MPKKGYKQSVEHRRKIAEAHKGKHHNQLTKTKISLMLKQYFRQQRQKELQEWTMFL